MDYIVYPLQDLFEWTFELFKYVQNGYNYAFIVIASIATVWWIAKMFKYQKHEVDNSHKGPLPAKK